MSLFKSVLAESARAEGNRRSASQRLTEYVATAAEQLLHRIRCQGIALSLVLIPTTLMAQEPRFHATPLDLPEVYAEPGAITSDGTIVGRAFLNAHQVDRVFSYQDNAATFYEELSFPPQQHCMPQAASRVGSVLHIAGTCGYGESISAWYWNGSHLRTLTGPVQYVSISGISSDGIIAGNISVAGEALHPAVLWNGADGSVLPISAALDGYTAGISDDGLVGLSLPARTYSLVSGEEAILPLPASGITPHSWGLTMTFDGTMAGEIEVWQGVRRRRAVMWRDGAIALDNPSPCHSPFPAEWVSKGYQDTLLVGCRVDSQNVVTYISLTSGEFTRLESRVSGLPQSQFPASLRVIRHSSSAGIMVAALSGDHRVWMITPIEEPNGGGRRRDGSSLLQDDIPYSVEGTAISSAPSPSRPTF